MGFYFENFFPPANHLHSIQQENIYFPHNSEKALLSPFFYIKKIAMSVEPI